MCRKVAGAELTAGVTVTLTFSKQDARIYIYYFRSKALALFFCYRKFFVFYNINSFVAQHDHINFRFITASVRYVTIENHLVF